VVAERARPQMEAVAAHVKGLSGYMTSGHTSVISTVAGQPTAAFLARQFKSAPQVLPDSITEAPEAAYLQFFCPPSEHSRDTVIMVGEDVLLMYMLLRALRMSPDEAKVATASYSIGHASVTLVNVKADGSMKVVAVGDTGHLPIACS